MRPVWQFNSYAGFGCWFRIFGVGLHFSIEDGRPLLFSERYGGWRFWRAFGWRIKVLT